MKGNLPSLTEGLEDEGLSEVENKYFDMLLEFLASQLCCATPVIDRPILVSFATFTDEDVVINLTGEASIEVYQAVGCLNMSTAEGHTLRLSAIIARDGTLTDPSCEFQFDDDTADTPPLECTIAWFTKPH